MSKKPSSFLAWVAVLLLFSPSLWATDSGSFSVSASILAVAPNVAINNLNLLGRPGDVITKIQAADFYSAENFDPDVNYTLTLNFISATTAVTTNQGKIVGVPLTHDNTIGGVLSYLAFRRNSGELVSFSDPIGCSLVGSNNTEIHFNLANQKSCKVMLAGLQANPGFKNNSMNTAFGSGDYQIAIEHDAASGNYSGVINFIFAAEPI